jgi:hypothetical protein
LAVEPSDLDSVLIQAWPLPFWKDVAGLMSIVTVFFSLLSSPKLVVLREESCVACGTSMSFLEISRSLYRVFVSGRIRKNRY